MRRSGDVLGSLEPRPPGTATLARERPERGRQQGVRVTHDPSAPVGAGPFGPYGGAAPGGYGPGPGYGPPAAAPAPVGWSPGAGWFTFAPRYASWGKRALALVIDELIMLSVPMVLYVVVAVGFTHDTGYDVYGNRTTEVRPTGVILLLLAWAIMIGVHVWNRAILQGRTGRSVGKHVLGIRLISERSGQPLGAGLAWVRDLVHLVDGILYIGYLRPLWEPRRRTFGDEIMASVVIDG